jgi:hypothetical protein
MGISRLVCVLMMNPMGGHPNQWPTFQAQGGAYRQKIFQPSRHLVAPVCEQAMVAHADSHINGDDMKSNGNHKRRPAKKEQRCDGSQVKKQHKAKHQPVH